MQKLKLQVLLIGFINVKDLNILVEVPELDGEGAAVVRPLASSSPAPVRILLSGAELFVKFNNFIVFIQSRPRIYPLLDPRMEDSVVLVS